MEALERIAQARHVRGERRQLAAPPLPALRFTIGPEGLIDAGGGEPNLSLKIRPSVLAGFARGEEHALRAVDVSGNARLASEVMLLARHLRWDFEEDLARLLGDVAAHRVAGTLRELAGWHADAARRLAAALADYATDEQPLLLRRGELTALAADVASLRDALVRLHKPVEPLA